MINLVELFNNYWNLEILGTRISNLTLSIIIFLFFFFTRDLFSKFLTKKIEILTLKFNKDFTKKLKTSLIGPLNFLPIVLGFSIAWNLAGFEKNVSTFFENLNKSFITVLIFWVIHQIIEPLIGLIKKIETHLSKDLLNWLIRATKIFIFVLGFAAVLELWGIKIGPIIAGLGLFGVAVALGAQDLFKNLISGILVLVEKRFKVGDVIIVDNIIEGVVEKISFRSTSIRKFDKSLCTIPNFQFAENAVTNISEITHRRINWIIGLEYVSTTEQLLNVKKEIQSFIEADPLFSNSENTKSIVRIDQFSASSIDLLVRCFIKTNDYNDWLIAKENLAINIKKIVEKNNAAFAFPSQSIYIEKEN